MKKVLAAFCGFFVKIYQSVVKGGDPTIVQLPADLQITPAEIDEVIKAVNIVKSVVNNPVTILVTDLTPITMDNEIRLAIAGALPDVIAELTFAKGLITGIEAPADKVNTLLANVRLSTDPAKDALYHNLAARLIMIASKGKVSWSDAVGIIEIYFKQMFGTAAEVTTEAIQPIAIETPVPALQVVAPVAPVVEAPVVVAQPEVLKAPAPAPSPSFNITI